MEPSEDLEEVIDLEWVLDVFDAAELTHVQAEINSAKATKAQWTAFLQDFREYKVIIVTITIIIFVAIAITITIAISLCSLHHLFSQSACSLCIMISLRRPLA